MTFRKCTYVFFAVCVWPCLAAIDTLQLKCQVCRRLVEDIQLNVSSVDPLHVVPAANFRLDGNGDQSKSTVPLARSQLYLTDVMDSVCAKMKDYVRATYKTDGSLTVMPLLLNGQMNPLMSEVDIIQDSDLNKSVQYYCEDIVSDIEDDLISLIRSGNDRNAVYDICTETAQLCPNKDNKVEL